MTTDFRALCAELLDEFVYHTDWSDAEELKERARAALADEPASVTGQPSDDELLRLYGVATPCHTVHEWERELNFARAVLARWGNPAPQPPAEGEVVELVAWLREQADHELGSTFDADYFSEDPAARNLNRAADLLQHLSPPQPVPVSERLQQMEDLAADAVAGLRYIEQSHGRLYGVGWDRVYKKADRLKPAHALPLPGQEVEG